MSTAARSQMAGTLTAALAVLDCGDGGRHGDPLRRILGSSHGRFALGVRFGGEYEFVLVDELAEQVIGGSRRAQTHAFTHIIRQFGGLVRQLQIANAGLRRENAELHDEVQSLAGDLDQARDGRMGGVA